MNLQKAIDRWRDQETYKKQSGIHWFVWLLENPKSPISLTGAIDLYHHDIIHILLNRGMEVKDEAVVIGFTMGNSETTKPWVKWLFEFCVRYLYPEGYRLHQMIWRSMKWDMLMAVHGRRRIYILLVLMYHRMSKL